MLHNDRGRWALSHLLTVVTALNLFIACSHTDASAGTTEVVNNHSTVEVNTASKQGSASAATPEYIRAPANVEKPTVVSGKAKWLFHSSGRCLKADSVDLGGQTVDLSLSHVMRDSPGCTSDKGLSTGEVTLLDCTKTSLGHRLLYGDTQRACEAAGHKLAAKFNQDEKIPAQARYAGILDQLGAPICADIVSLPFEIVQKIDDHHYEMIAEATSDPIHLILETKQAVFMSAGHPVGIGVEDAAPRMIRMQSGFDQQIMALRECEIIPYKQPIPNRPGFAFRREINGH